MQASPSQPQRPKILILLPYPTRDDMSAGSTFSAKSRAGEELGRMLNDAGILLSDCAVITAMRTLPRFKQKSTVPEGTFITYGKHPVPTPEFAKEIERVWSEIDAIQPNLILAAGELSLWLTQGKQSITKWRGSQLAGASPSGAWHGKVIPIFSPTDVLRQWSWRYITIRDLRRAQFESESSQHVEPPYNFLTRPSFDQAMMELTKLLAYGGHVSCDIETRAGHIACVGFATSKHDAFCIPFMCTERPQGYWTEEQEIEIVLLICEIFRTPGIRWSFQNGIYDIQYFARHWGAVPKIWLDTMLVHHVCWAGLPKGLDYISSLYCEFHQYWKSEGKNWDPRQHSEDDFWRYNCKDAVITWEAAEVLDRTVDKLGLRSAADFQMRQFPAVLRMMLRGVRQNAARRNALNMELLNAELERHQYIQDVVGFPLNPKSPKQMKEFFYGALALPVQKNRKTHEPTLDEEALIKLAKREPIIRPLVNRILELRTLGVFRSTFINMRMDTDGRMRCSYNIAGTETYRYSSSEDAFGLGGNLQNIPEGDEANHLPNVRKLFLPDPDFTVADCDLAGADAQVVAWEADDDELKTLFRAGADVHLENARVIFNNPRITKDDPRRKLAKAGVHATNYYAQPPTLARALGITVREAEIFQRRWFLAHPGIKDWHRRVEDSLASRRYVENKFGFRRYYFDRIEGLLPEALAWIPQSTVALVIDQGLVKISETLDPAVQLLLQVHDSLVMQFRTYKQAELLPKIRDALRVPIPYADPLTISAGIKVSTISWGDCTPIAWPQ